MSESNYFDELRNDYKKIENEDAIVKTIEKNPELIEALPMKRLEQFETILDKKIKEETEKNKKLNAEIEALNKKINMA